MDLNTKYHVGEQVWFMRNNKPVKERILGVEVTFTCGTMGSYYGASGREFRKNIRYSIENRVNKDCECYCEDYLFATKEELFNHLFFKSCEN